jgi:hypothetical protein
MVRFPALGWSHRTLSLRSLALDLHFLPGVREFERIIEAYTDHDQRQAQHQYPCAHRRRA